MAPPKQPKKPLKSMEKPIEKPIMKTKKAKKKNYQSFSIYLFKLLRSLGSDNLGISKKSMLIMNNFVNDMLETIAAEAGKLVAHGKKTTLGSREIQSAIKLLIPGELAKHANIEGMKAVTMYHNNSKKPAESKTDGISPTLSMSCRNWELYVSVAFYFGAKIISYTYKTLRYTSYTCRMFRQDALTSIPERSEVEEPLKWVPKKKHEVLKAKYKCLKKLFQIYDASVIGALPAPIEFADDTNTKRRLKRSHRTKTDACAGTTEIIYSGDITQAEYDVASIASESQDLKIKQSCSTQMDSKCENSSIQSHASKSEVTSNSETNTDFSETKCSKESLSEKCTHLPQNHLPQHVVPYLVMNERRKLTRFQSFVQRIFGMRQNYILPNDAYTASECFQDGRRRRGLRFRRSVSSRLVSSLNLTQRLRRAKKIKSESDIKDLKSSAILSYIQSVQKSCLMDTTPRQCPIVGCKMISYGIINYNDHLNLCHFKDRKYFCHYCHEGFEKEYDKFIHENEHIGLNKLSTNISNLSTSRNKLASNSNTQTDPDVIPEEKLKKIVSFFDKITNPDEIVTEIRKKRSSETNLTKDTDTESQNFSEKRTSSCMNIRKCKCESNSHTSVTSRQYGPAVTCHIGGNLQYRRQLSLHEHLERRNRDRFSKFHSCDGIMNRPRRDCKHDKQDSSQDFVYQDGRLNVRSIDSSSITESAYSTVTPSLSEVKLTEGKSEESLTCDPSTNIVYYTSLETVKEPSVKALVRKIRNYKWEPGTKVIHV